MNTWVREEAVRQIKATCERDRQRDGIPKGGHSPCCHAEEVAESCLRAGLLEAARRLDHHADGCCQESCEGDSNCFSWMDRMQDAERYARELRAIAGEEPKHG